MNMRKALPLFVIASMMAALIPSALVGAAVTNTLSVAVGPVGTKTVVSGTITTWAGRYQIEIDANNDGDFLDTGEQLAGFTDTLRSDGYAYSQEIQIPNAYGGARRIRVIDLDAAGTPFADSFFTVQFQWLLEIDLEENFEGGAFTLNATVTGGDPSWPGALDLRFRIKDPSAVVIAGETFAYTNLIEVGGYGRFEQLHGLPAVATNFVTWGVYTSLLDWSTLADWPTGNQGVASATFTIRLTEQAIYERTEQVNFQARVPAGKTLDKVTLTDPNGTEVILFGPGMGAVGPVWTAGLVMNTVKNTLLGTYTLKLYDLGTGTAFKTQTFILIKAGFVVKIFALGDYDETSKYTIADNINTANEEVERMHTVRMMVHITYPDGSSVTSGDLVAGFSVWVGYNSTNVATVALDSLLAYSVPNHWTVSWKIPKDAVLGKNYHMKILIDAMSDEYGNSGPSKEFDSAKGTFGNYWKVIKCQLYSGANPGGVAPVLSYPGAGNTLARTVESRASADIRYPDESKVTGSDLSQANATLTCTGNTYTVPVVAADYNDAVDLWVVKFSTPYNAPLVGDYRYSVLANNFKDLWGNKGPVGATPDSLTFVVGIAAITVTDVTVDKTAVQTDEQITVTFSATYPSGAAVTTRAATWPQVDIVDSGGNIINAASNRASYDSATHLWKYVYIIPTGSVGGEYNATVAVNHVQDGAATPNTGPSAKKYTNFDVTRVSMTDVLAAANAAKAAADLASAKADAAKVAADAALAAADAAKAAADAATAAATATGTTATSALTAANAATAAANAAKTSADAAKAATDSLTTMVYVAIAASVVAALAAIFAVMQITKKIA